ncbi:hypothetical protein PBI_MANGETHE_55 [Mycobacterium phage Mangethe]|nr:hypothetical protein I5J48_gp55 [Mycobacterium phage Majeke]ASR84907.1 hypothetical protein SEA_STEVIERAY_55 [Mycobacterium phage StevieRay]AYQ99888.1 hypothetical protein PBI_MANGETHE_55 [Mycobacterium phage Mangethe]QBI98014.1 hypothetical protein SEA_ZILIZEBETH_55 [Mycobacterium phage Zilizebeth]QDK01246.1 hypothetical protein SEA_BUNNIES_56 [Mycobacterium phage Bunnies]ASZ75315.1 hypothetical protein PBI_MAJEKE_55 [Mycobacterium phage Majeke]
MTFNVNDRVTTGPGGLVGTVVELFDDDPDYVLVEWDHEELGPQEDEVEVAELQLVED